MERPKMQISSIATRAIVTQFVVGVLALAFGACGVVGQTLTRKTVFKAANGSPIVQGIKDAPVSAVAADFNKDGILDLAIANSSDNSISVLLGKGDGTFVPAPGSPLSTGGNLTTAVAVGDFNNDGKLDIVATDLPGGLSGLFDDFFGSVGNLAVLDGDHINEAGPKSIPRMCMACHGGTCDKNAHSATGASFLPFDVFYFRYSGKDDFTFDDQAESFRKLNAIVASTKPTAAIQEFISGTYPGGVNTPNSAALDGFTPTGWADNPRLYHGVVRQYCRMCHLAQPESFAKSSDFVD